MARKYFILTSTFNNYTTLNYITDENLAKVKLSCLSTARALRLSFVLFVIRCLHLRIIIFFFQSYMVLALAYEDRYQLFH